MGLGLQSTTTLANGVEIPWLGLGTYLAEGSEAYEAVGTALDVGYRHVDTAALYGNEREVGRAVRDSGVPREEVFVTTKLWNGDHGLQQAADAFHRSRDRLDLGPIDLYLIHWPVPELRGDSWRALEQVYEQGLVRAIGVSNYMPWHLRELLDHCEVPPTVNQVEFSPFLLQQDLLQTCRERDIQLQAYSPLTKGKRLDDPRLLAIAEQVGRSPAQVLIRWCLQRGLVVLAKSSTPAHIRDNADVFDWELSAEEMADLDALDEGLRTSWDPSGEP